MRQAGRMIPKDRVGEESGHTNPKRQRGECRRNLADASGE